MSMFSSFILLERMFYNTQCQPSSLDFTGPLLWTDNAQLKDILPHPFKAAELIRGKHEEIKSIYFILMSLIYICSCVPRNFHLCQFGDPLEAFKNTGDTNPRRQHITRAYADGGPQSAPSKPLELEYGTNPRSETCPKVIYYTKKAPDSCPTTSQSLQGDARYTELQHSDSWVPPTSLSTNHWLRQLCKSTSLLIPHKPALPNSLVIKLHSWS